MDMDRKLRLTDSEREKVRTYRDKTVDHLEIFTASQKAHNNVAFFFFQGMAELEADVIETMKRFDKLSTNMDKLFEAASKC
jgi:hypothetical protein